MSKGSECAQGASVEGSECARRTILEGHQAAEALSVQGESTGKGSESGRGTSVQGDCAQRESEQEKGLSVQGQQEHVGTSTWEQVCKETGVQREPGLQDSKIPKGTSMEGEHVCAVCRGSRCAKGGSVSRECAKGV